MYVNKRSHVVSNQDAETSSLHWLQTANYETVVVSITVDASEQSLMEVIPVMLTSKNVAQSVRV